MIGFWAPSIESDAAPQRCMRWTIEALDQRGDVEVVHGSPGPADVPFDHVDVESPAELVRAGGVDVVHWTKLMDTTFPAALDVPAVLTYHGDVQWSHPSLNYGSHPWTTSVKECLADLGKLWQYDAVFFVSDDLHSRMQRRFGRLLPETHTTLNAPAPYIEPDDPPADEYVFHVSVHGPRKNPKNLLRGFARADVDQRLVIAGSGWDAEKDLIDRLDIDVELLGYVPNDELAGWYTGADAFLFPSLHECFGLPALEAMRCGTVPAVSRTYSLPEVVGSTGEYCDPNDPASIAAAVERAVVRDPRPARKRSMKFGWDKTAEELVKIYHYL